MKAISPWIHTTEKCNLKCKYCYVKGTSTMSKSIYDAMEVFLLDKQFEHIHLRFAGGEPLLVFDIWKGFAERMLKDERVSIEVLTNFQVVPNNFWNFADNKKVYVSVSIDNDKDIKPLTREMNYKLKKLREPWILTTLTENNIDNINLLASFVGMNNYGWALTTDYFWQHAVSFDKLLNKLVEILYILNEFNYDFTKITFNNCTIKSNFNGCKAGTEMIAIGCDGSIYQCQTLINKKNKIIGNIFDGYKPTPLAKFGCDKCEINQVTCYNWCPLYHKANDKLCDVMRIFSCELVKLALKEEIKNAK